MIFNFNRYGGVISLFINKKYILVEFIKIVSLLNWFMYFTKRP